MGSHLPETSRPPARILFGRQLASPQVILIALAAAFILLAADQLAKGAIVHRYEANETIARGSLVSLVYVTNTGGICGYGQNAGTLLTVVGIATTGLVLLAAVLIPDSPLYGLAFGMLLAGSAGNLIDRLRYGEVIDFITVHLLRLPSFNLADGWIVGGIGLVGLLTILEWLQERDSTRALTGSQLGWGAAIALLLILLAIGAVYMFCVLRPFG